jgi:hypothetical protein
MIFYKKSTIKFDNRKFKETKVRRRFLEELKMKVDIFREIKNTLNLNIIFICESLYTLVEDLYICPI